MRFFFCSRTKRLFYFTFLPSEQEYLILLCCLGAHCAAALFLLSLLGCRVTEIQICISTPLVLLFSWFEASAETRLPATEARCLREGRNRQKLI